MTTVCCTRDRGEDVEHAAASSSPFALPLPLSLTLARLSLGSRPPPSTHIPLHVQAHGRSVNFSAPSCKKDKHKLLSKTSWTSRDVLRIQTLYAKKKKKKKKTTTTTTTTATRPTRLRGKGKASGILCPLCRAAVPKQFLSEQKKEDPETMVKMYRLLYFPRMAERENVLWFELGAREWDRR